jgi:voltage-gated potassium channel Kch
MQSQAVCDAITIGNKEQKFAVFDLNPVRVAAGLQSGAPIVYGDGSSAELLRAAGISAPSAIVVTYSGAERCYETTQKLHQAFPNSPIYTRARFKAELSNLYSAGASEVRPAPSRDTPAPLEACPPAFTATATPTIHIRC